MIKSKIKFLIKALVIVFSFDLSSSNLIFETIQPEIIERIPVNISIYDAGDGVPGLAYKLTDSKTPGDIYSTRLNNSSWIEPFVTGLLSQNDHELGSIIQLTNNSNMMLMRGDNTDYAKLFGLSLPQVDTVNESDEILPDISNEELINLLDDNQQLYMSLENGYGWSVPQLIKGTSRAFRPVLQAGNSGTALVIYSVDTDGDKATKNDIEIFYIIYRNNSWATPMKLTDNNFPEYAYKIEYVNSQFVLTWLQDEDGDLSTSTDSRLRYGVIDNAGNIVVESAALFTQKKVNSVYALGNDGTDAIIIWSSQLADKSFQLNESRFNGNVWSTVNPINISVSDFKNANIYNVAGNLILVFQRGNNINIARYNGSEWKEVVVFDELEKQAIIYDDINYNVINNTLWIAYSGHIPIVNESENLDVGSGLYVASYLLDYDLSVKYIRAGSNGLNIGQKSDLLIDISNDSVVDSPAYKINIYQNDILLTTLNGDSLLSGATQVFKYQYTPIVVEADIRVDVILSGQDANQLNNSKIERINIYPDFYVNKVTRIDSTKFEVDIREKKGIATSSVEIEAYLQISGIQTELATKTYNPTSVDPVVFTIPSVSILTSDFKILFKVNPSRTIIEDSFSNNFGIYEYKVDTKADYQIDQIRVTDNNVQLYFSNNGILNSSTVDLLITDDPIQAATSSVLTTPWYFQKITFDEEGKSNLTLPRTILPQLSGQYLYAVINPYGRLEETNRNNNLIKKLVVPSVSQPIGSVVLSIQNEIYLCGNLRFDVENTGGIAAQGVKVSLITVEGGVLASNQLPYLASSDIETVTFHNVETSIYQLKVQYFIDGKYVLQIDKSIDLTADACASTTIEYDFSLAELSSLGLDAGGVYTFDIDLRTKGYIADYRKSLIKNSPNLRS